MYDDERDGPPRDREVKGDLRRELDRKRSDERDNKEDYRGGREFQRGGRRVSYINKIPHYYNPTTILLLEVFFCLNGILIPYYPYLTSLKTLRRAYLSLNIATDK